MKFGKKLEASQYSPWHAHYLDYNSLKKLLESKPNNDTDNSHAGAIQAVAVPVGYDSVMEAEFRSSLDHEIEKAVLFFLEKQGEIATTLSFLCLKKVQLQHEKLNTMSAEELPVYLAEVSSLVSDYRCAGKDLLRLVHFIEMNVIAVRKILKKHDKKKSQANKLSSRYLTNYVHGADSHLQQLYHYGGITSLVATMQNSFRELRYLEASIQEAQHGPVQIHHTTEKSHHRTKSAPAPTHLRTTSEPFLDSDVEDFPVQRARAESFGSHPWHSERLEPDAPEPIVVQINLARRRLQQSTWYVNVLAAQSLFFDRSESREELFIEEEEGDGKLLEKTRRQKISSFLNLMSTFLYMTNYYIVAPTCGVYAEKLGGSPAMSGVIIGMTPIAALLSSFLYGWWSNRSYKSALLFAAFCSLLGDILYALALPYNSLGMVIAGRFLNGFGSARAINRRFIADTFNRSDRTAASAAFVTAGALGMAAGPAIAAAIGKWSYENEVWTVETGPGYVMFGIWSCFFISMIFLFEEPDRHHQHRSPAVELVGETRALLPSSSTGKLNDSNHDLKKTAPPPLWTNIPVMMTLGIYFVLKLVLECLLSSSASLSKYYFDWNIQMSGMYLATLGLLMFPANLVVAGLSSRYDDREIIMASLLAMLFGIGGYVYYGDEPYTVAQFVIFGIIIFVSTNCLEGPNMALLSKTIPRSWAKGTFNSGLLATEAGTLGRAVGDLFISAIASIGFEYLLNGTFIPLGILVLATIALTWKLYAYLEPADDDDD